MRFKKFQHVCRLGTSEVQDVLDGKCYIFPKIDGTNASLWWTIKDGVGELNAGSRNRELSLDNDNAGFFNWATSQPQAKYISEFFRENPNIRLYGEWLVPHSLKTYRDDAWRKLYVFDVAVDIPESEITHDSADRVEYLNYDEYSQLLDCYPEIEYIRPLAIITNPTYDMLITQMKKNNYLIKNGEGIGEGIVIKNYDKVNRYGRVTWAKIISAEFGEQHRKVMGAPESEGKKMVEDEIAEKYVTKSLCDKVRAKIELDEGSWESKYIPRLLNTVFHDVVEEESWNFIKEYKNPTINFKTLQSFVYNRVKKLMLI
jgi:hypothetical protein